jgi:hypothetical protein
VIRVETIGPGCGVISFGWRRKARKERSERKVSLGEGPSQGRPIDVNLRAMHNRS